MTAKSMRPLHDRVIVRRAPHVTASGIVIPESVTGDKPQQGEVVAVGPGKILDNGNIRKCDVKVGDKILFGKYSGTEVKVDGQDLLVMREEDIIGVIEA